MSEFIDYMNTGLGKYIHRQGKPKDELEQLKVAIDRFQILFRVEFSFLADIYSSQYDSEILTG